MDINEIQIRSDTDVGPTYTDIHATFVLRNNAAGEPYRLKHAMGLDPGDIVRTYDDGPSFFRVRPKERVITLLVGLDEEYRGEKTIGQLRDELYKIISYNTRSLYYNLESRLEIHLRSENGYAGSFYGFITKVEADLFTPDPTVTITIECDNPFLQYKNGTALTDIDNTPPAESHEFNTVSYDVSSTLSYTDEFSTSPHGFSANLLCDADSTGFIIWDKRNIDQYLFIVVFPFLDGDEIYFSSDPLSKAVTLFRPDDLDNPIVSLLDRIAPGSIWPLILPGTNEFQFSEPIKITDAEHKYTFWGV